jgi:Protein of unknown function (DUF3795)
MFNQVQFDHSMIAPCGMNCGTCLAYLRKKNHCPGCRVFSSDKAVSIRRCIIPGCERLVKTESGYCYECPKFACRRVKQLDKRYRTKYRTSFIENLLMIQEQGMEIFLAFESGRRTCPHCGSTLCVHRPFCLKCKIEII